jgi:hypothetical protein
LHVHPEWGRLRSISGGRQNNKAAREAACRLGTYATFEKSGAGEGIRTLDPDLGKVVLYH